MDDLLNDFLLETAEALPLVEAELVAFEADRSRRESLNAVFRAVHSLKGACGFLHLPRLEALAHAAESLLARFRQAPEAATPDAVTLAFQAIDDIRAAISHLELVGAEPAGNDSELIGALELAGGELTAPVPARSAPSVQSPVPAPPSPPEPAGRTIRVDVDVLDRLSSGVDELVRTRNQLLELLPSLGDAALRAPLQRLSVITGELQDDMQRARLQPVGGAWRALPRAVRDLSLRLRKDIELRVDGGSVEVDREMVEALKDPLAHLVRNAADHGLESPPERQAAGKPLKGVLKLAAWTEGDTLLIRVSDDGRGLDADAIRYAAVADGWLTPAEAAGLPDAQAHRLVFVPGLTTLTGATRVSGRGVGLDAVKAAVERLGGRVSIGSTPGRGTTFTLRVPLTREVSAQAPAPLVAEAAPPSPSVGAKAPAPLMAIEPSPAPRQRRILLVEGSPFLRNMMTPLLTAAGYEVTAAASPEDAWRLHATGSDFDAIVSDLDSAGEAFPRRLDDSRWSAAPRIALTDLPPAQTPAPGFAEVVRKSDRQGLIAVLSGALGLEIADEEAA